MPRKFLIASAFIVLASVGIDLAVQKSAVEDRLSLCTQAYQQALKVDTSGDCNPEIKELVDDLEKAEQEKREYQQKYLELLVEKTLEIKNNKRRRQQCPRGYIKDLIEDGLKNMK